MHGLFVLLFFWRGLQNSLFWSGSDSTIGMRYTQPIPASARCPSRSVAAASVPSCVKERRGIWHITVLVSHSGAWRAERSEIFSAAPDAAASCNAKNNAQKNFFISISLKILGGAIGARNFGQFFS